MNGNIAINNCIFTYVYGQIMKAFPAKISRVDIPLLVNIKNSFI